MLANRLGLGDRVVYRHGNALAMPYEDGSFAVVWTQQGAMKIPDKAQLVAEMRRVLRPGGLLAIYNVCAGPGGPPHFPLPWTRDPSISFLIAPEELRELLQATGLEILRWRDTTEVAPTWYRTVPRLMPQGGPPPLGFHLLLGPDSWIMRGNQIRNVPEHRITLIETVARRR